jgi:hypothetical protein
MTTAGLPEFRARPAGGTDSVEEEFRYDVVPGAQEFSAPSDGSNTSLE